MQRLEQRDLDDLVMFVFGCLCGFYGTILIQTVIGCILKGYADSKDICLMNLTIQGFADAPKSARTIAKIIYDVLSRMK